MKRLLSFSFLLALLLIGCNTSEGTKSGVLQKVSHKKLPCPYYSAQIGFQSGTAGVNSSYSSVQDFTISKEIYDSMSSHVGEQVVFVYEDRGAAICEESKLILAIRVKK